MSLPVVLLDIDGVICDFSTPVVAKINHYLGTAYTPEDVHEWDIYSALNVPGDVPIKIDAEIADAGFCKSLQPYAGAFEFLDQLRLFADVVPVTAPFKSSNWIPEREAWLASFGFSRKDIVFTAAKHRVSGAAIIDDRLSNLTKWTNAQFGHALLFDRPWNRRTPTTGRIRRVSGYAELLGSLRQRLQNERY